MRPPTGVIEHPTLGRVPYRVDVVSDDPDTQVAQTIGIMGEYVREDSRRPEFFADVYRAQTGEPLADTWHYLRRNGARGMQFVRDEITGGPASGTVVDRWQPIVETLIRPVDQANMPQPQGDCDDFAMYGAAQLTARGVPVRFVTVAADEQDPSVYSHVYLVAYPKDGPYAGRRVPVDLSHGRYLGWEVPNMFGKRREWDLEGSILPWIAGAVLGIGALCAYQRWKGNI